MEIIIPILIFVIAFILGWFAYRFYSGGAVRRLRVELKEAKALNQSLIEQLTESKRGRAVLNTYQIEAERTKIEANKARDAVFEAQREIVDLKEQISELEKQRVVAATAAQAEINALKARLDNLNKTRAAHEEVARLKAELAEADKYYAAQEEIRKLRRLLTASHEQPEEGKASKIKTSQRKAR